RRDHAEAGFEQLAYILIALLVPASRHVGVGELVDHAHLRSPLQDGVDVHFFEHDAAILDLPPRDDLEVANLGFGFGAAVGFNEADHDIHTLPPERVRVLEHRVGLANA